MNLWKEHTLKEITTKIGSGSTPRGGKESYVETGVPLVRSLNVHGLEFQFQNLAYINERQAKKLEGVTVQSGDVLLNITGASVGRCTMIPDELVPARVNQHVAIIRANPDLLSPHFLMYALNTSFYHDALMMIADTGSTREALTKDDIQKFKIRIPQVSEQNSIVAILNSYTRLIDLNNDRCKNLESECSELFKEWFVRMRFPGSKAVTFEKGIPIDWEVKSIGCVVNYHIGGGWGSDVQDKIFSTSGYVIRGTDLPNIKSGIANLEVLRYHKLSNIKSRELQEGDIIFETAGGSEGQPLGRTCYITQEILDAYGDKAIAASFCKQIRTTSIPSMYLYYFLNYLWDTGMIETYQVQSTGISNFQFEPFLKFQQIILPDKNLMQKFHDIVLPMHKQIATLGTQNTKLREIRDRLLPRLISGKLQVKSGEIESLVPSSTKEANLA